MINSESPKWITVQDKPNRTQRRAALKKLRGNLGSRVWHERLAQFALDVQMQKHEKEKLEAKKADNA